MTADCTQAMWRSVFVAAPVAGCPSPCRPLPRVVESAKGVVDKAARIDLDEDLGCCVPYAAQLLPALCFGMQQLGRY